MLTKIQNAALAITFTSGLLAMFVLGIVMLPLMVGAVITYIAYHFLNGFRG